MMLEKKRFTIVLFQVIYFIRKTQFYANILDFEFKIRPKNMVSHADNIKHSVVWLMDFRCAIGQK